MMVFLILVIVSLCIGLGLAGTTIFIRRKLTNVDERLLSDGERDLVDRCPISLQGNSLFYWAKDVAAAITRHCLNKPLSKELPIELSQSVHADATSAMIPFSAFAHEVDEIACPDGGLGAIGVTAPEALEIADYLTRNLPAAERDRILKLAKSNALKLVGESDRECDGQRLPCPLQGHDHVCVAYLARPLRCRPFHVSEIWRQRGLKRQLDEERDRDEVVVAQGAEAGLVEALEQEGRSADVYELNSALVAALETPHAAERWANGEEIFHSCGRRR